MPSRAVAEDLGRAADGDQAAWDRLVDRFAPLIWAVCRRHRLSDADCEDVGSTVWLRLVERLGTIREPAALPGWLATTTRHECLQLMRARSRQVLTGEDDGAADPEAVTPEEWLLEQERGILLRSAFEDLGERCRRLLALLFADPPTPYAEVSATLGMPVGAIGPTRRRCLAALREHPSLSELAGSV